MSHEGSQGWDAILREEILRTPVSHLCNVHDKGEIRIPRRRSWRLVGPGYQRRHSVLARAVSRRAQGFTRRRFIPTRAVQNRDREGAAFPLLTNRFPAIRNRNGQSAQCVIPMRGVTSVSKTAWRCRLRTCKGPVTRLDPFKFLVIPSANVSLPGPPARSSIRRAAGRLLCISAIPESGSRARIRTHPACPSGSATKFRHSYMP